MKHCYERKLNIFQYLLKIVWDTLSLIFEHKKYFELLFTCMTTYFICSFLAEVELKVGVVVLAIILFRCYLGVVNNKELEQKRRDRVHWLSLTGWEFEKEVARVLRKNGYEKVRVTRGSGDGGIDIVAYRSGLKFAIQCKNWTHPVDPTNVRATYGVKDDFKADVVILVASSGVTKSGKEFIKRKNDYYLLTVEDIIEMDNRRN